MEHSNPAILRLDQEKTQVAKGVPVARIDNVNLVSFAMLPEYALQTDLEQSFGEWSRSKA